MKTILLFNAVGILSLMLCVWLMSVRRSDVSIVDIVWGMGFVLVAWTSWAVRDAGERSLWIPVLTTVWGVRLSGYLTWRNHGKPEDHRYAAMREKHGTAFRWISLFTVFLLQGLILFLVSMPQQLAQAYREDRVALLITGIVLFSVGFCFETVGDWQLARFRRNPENKGRVLNTGLWRLTRHPNYFGDFCVWWGLGVLSLSCGAPVLVLASCVLMSILLLRISGVALLEKSLVSRRDGYAEYIRRTSAFFPWPPRN